MTRGLTNSPAGGEPASGCELLPGGTADGGLTESGVAGLGFHVVLVEPEIPPNAGNVARLCAATRSTLHLVEPFGFRLDDRRLRRAGMDYWQQVVWRRWPSWAAFRAGLAAGARLWLVESGGPRRYTEADYRAGDYLVFGRETAGLPRALLEAGRERWVRLPMFNPAARSLNLANCVAVVLFEALRQHGFAGELAVGGTGLRGGEEPA
jgi:tRNA (cytidine/uridine-2'-O-)-methyltransferase